MELWEKCCSGSEYHYLIIYNQKVLAFKTERVNASKSRQSPRHVEAFRLKCH